MADSIFDCVIVGAGPAGLSAAVYLGRLRRKVLVIDDRHGRSTWHQVNRNYLGFPDGVHATALRELGRKQAERYGVQFCAAHASNVSVAGDKDERRFTVATDKGDFVGKTLILATGVSDHFPEFDGSEECIGKSMFWCIICDGYEAIDKRVVVLGHDDHAAAVALQLLVFTERVTLISGEQLFDFSPERMEALRSHGVRVVEAGANICQGGGGQTTARHHSRGVLRK